jgi:hypothetical protein
VPYGEAVVAVPSRLLAIAAVAHPVAIDEIH